jgi:uncharacterized damage-inducible protein DinB
MASEREILEDMTRRALAGEDAHVTAEAVFSGLDWKVAGVRIESAVHTLFQLLNHIVYWQEWAVKWLDGRKPAAPKRASGSWPGGDCPVNKREWERAVSRLEKALSELRLRARQDKLFVRRGRTSHIEMLRTIGSHTSYHVGQAALLRQQLGAWPPPSGGVTW